MKNHALLGPLILAVALIGGVFASSATAAKVTPVTPWQPGDQVWLAPPGLQTLNPSPLSSGCERVPVSGYIGTNVYAETGTYLSTLWNWTAASSSEPFHWYVFNAAGSILADAHSNGTGGSTVVSNGYRYWKVENLGALPQAWNVCFD